MKLHIGCGDKYLEGFKHYDARKISDKIDYIGNADDLSIFSDNSIEEIYACHILEHFKRHEVDNVLKEWNRVLIPYGILRVAVPDFEAIVGYYNDTGDVYKIMGLLYGGQNYEYNFHYVCFDYKSMSERLSNAGFENIRRYEWREFLPPDYDDFSRAYLPHMDFENGRLMSLNIICNKASR